MEKLAGLLLCAFLLLCGGCTPREVETPPTVSSIPDDPAVRTDWSQLTPYEPDRGVYTRRYEAFTDTLIPSRDYGPLVPYLGDVAGKLHGDGYDGGIYGLVTLKGEIVTDPVFKTVWQGGAAYQNGGGPLPYRMLCRVTSSSSPDEWPDEALWAMCALDGSWCTQFKYTMDGELVTWGRSIGPGCTEDGLFAADGSALVYLDGATGRERLRMEDIPADGLWEALWTAFWRGNTAYYACDNGDDYFAVDAGTGKRTQLTREEAEAIRSEGAEDVPYQEDFVWGQVVFQGPTDGVYPVVTTDGRVLSPGIDMDYFYGAYGYDQLTGEKYVRLPTGQGYDFYDDTGALLGSLPCRPSPYDAYGMALVGGLIYTVTDNYSGLCGFDGNWVFRYPLPVGEWD